jgi:hypothetical protein
MAAANCSLCGADVPVELAGQARLACPHCGSLSRAFTVHAESAVEVLSKLRLRQKRPGKKGNLVELIQGWEPRRAVGDFIRKIRRIDRAEDRYFEEVRDASGTLVHHRDHRLSEHTGHGSDKPR